MSLGDDTGPVVGIRCHHENAVMQRLVDLVFVVTGTLLGQLVQAFANLLAPASALAVVFGFQNDAVSKFNRSSPHPCGTDVHLEVF